MKHLISLASSKLGVDSAIKWTLFSQIIRFITGPITMFLMVRYLSPEVQGYAYTFASVLGISIFLEMGFSQNILQFASHEFSRLKLTESREISGDPVAYSRLISLGRLSFKYYLVAAIAFFGVLLVGGIWFFNSSADVGIAWQGPWMTACVTAALSLAINPCWSLLEGCNQIPDVERFRFFSTIGMFATGATSMILGFGLYAVVLPSVLGLLFSCLYLIFRWPRFFAMFTQSPPGATISWKKEIWPFQWRIAISWISGYFIFTLVTPIIFRSAGPTQAGKFGFTLQLVRMIAGVSSSWSTAKLPLFGMLVRSQNWLELDRIWLRATKSSLLVACVGSAGMIVGLELASSIFPSLTGRYAGGTVAALLCGSMICQTLTTSFAYYLRAFKEESFMFLSVANAILTTTLVIALVSRWGIHGAALGYAIAIWIIAIPAYLIFSRRRRLLTLVTR